MGRGFGQFDSFEHHGVHGDDDAGTRHRKGGDLGAKHQTERRLEHASGDWERDDVVTNGPSKVLAHLAQRSTSDL